MTHLIAIRAKDFKKKSFGSVSRILNERLRDNQNLSSVDDAVVLAAQGKIDESDYI